jgi:hypothetical protein
MCPCSFAVRRSAPFLVLILAFPACIFDPPTEIPPNPQPTEFDRSTPDKTLRSFEVVWIGKNHAWYQELLHDGYEFFPLEEDADDLPWLVGQSWGRTAELDMAEHMFDSNFTGGNGAVDLIELDLTKQQDWLFDAARQRCEVVCTLIGRVMWTATDGASFDTRVLIELVRDPDEPELWQIDKQLEISNH